MINLDSIQPQTYEFTLGGKVYQIPTLDGLEVQPVLDIIEDGKKVTEGDVAALFRSLMRKHAPEALEQMSVAQLSALMKDYLSGGDLGESSASSD